MKFARTRLAPSPTGALHLGHARTFLVTWWMARQAGAKIFMRMEDLDAGRAKPESVQQAYDDLRWLGMEWDAWEETRNEVVQSGRMALYESVLQTLWEKGAIYPCTCTRADIAASVAAGASAPHAGDAIVRYPGTCAEKDYAKYRGQRISDVLAAVRADTGKNACWRLRVRPGVRQFDDVIAGHQELDVAAEVGDFPLTRFDGPPPAPAYQLASVVVVHAMGTDMVVRGDDLLSSTPRQMCLYEAMGCSPQEMPRFAHVPLVLGADGRRLAKRHGESRVAEFRAAGVKPERIVGWAAWRCGQLPEPQELSAREVLAIFELEKLPRGEVTMGERDFAWLR